MRLKDVMNRDVTTIPDDQLKEATQKLVDTANRRIRDLHDRMLNTTALRSLGKKDSFDIKGISPTNKRGRERMEREFLRAKRFLEAKTSTVRGAESVIHEIQQKLHIEQAVNEEWTADDKQSFFDILNEMEERCPNLVFKLADSDIAEIIMKKVKYQKKHHGDEPLNWERIRKYTKRSIDRYKKKQGVTENVNIDPWTDLGKPKTRSRSRSKKNSWNK